MIPGKLFTKKVEDFVCARCGTAVQGTGYTNHCPVCLWSKHVDVNPGDRAEACGGMMEPIGLTMVGQRARIEYRCATCGIRRRFFAADNDSPDTLALLSKKPLRL